MTTGKTAAVAVGNKLAPELTKKALEYVPVVGTIITVANTAWSVYKLGKGIKDLIRARKKPHLQGPKLQLPQQNNGSGSNSGGSNGGGGGRQGGTSAAAGSIAYGVVKKAVKAQRETNVFGNMGEVFKNAPVGKILKKASEGTSWHCKGAKIFRAMQDIVEYGIKKGDLFYFDTLHKDHIEVFKKGGEVMRTVLNMDGTQNLKKLEAGLKHARDILKWIGKS